MKLKYAISLLLLLTFMFSCKEQVKDTSSNDEVQTQAPKMMGHYPEWSKNMNMYEVNIRQYTEEGSFSAFAEHIPRLKDMGVDILWFMPVYPISDTKKKGSMGSYYAISDYTKVNPEFGSLAEFRDMVKKIHDAGMKIILDFVPNHTGWDHVWIKEHPDYYSKDDKGNIIDPIDPSTGKSWGWTDVADLNFENAEMRQAMIDDMLYWINEEDIDGFRMDVAHGVPVSFWGEVSKALTAAKTDVFMLAESEVTDLRNKKYFQVDYGWAFHHLLNHIAKGENGPEDVKKWYAENQSKYNQGWHIQFTSNHDENSWAGTTAERMGDAHDVLAVLAYTLEGMPLIYGGQEEPLNKRLEFFEKDPIGFGQYAKADFFKSILDLKHKNRALWNGPFGGRPEFLHVDDQVLIYKREKEGASVICMLNLSDAPAKLKVPDGADALSVALGDSTAKHKSGDEIILDAWGYLVLGS